MLVRALARDELPRVRELLASSELPIDDIDDPSITLIGAFDDAVLAGVIGLQDCGGVGLLRSLAVTPQHRDRGVARLLCERVFAMTAERKLESLWLLTLSARDYFTRHAFVEVPRETAPAAIRATAPFGSLCPASAHVMRR